MGNTSATDSDAKTIHDDDISGNDAPPLFHERIQFMTASSALRSGPADYSTRFNHACITTVSYLALAAAAAGANAPADEIREFTVTATRIAANSFDVPASISSVSGDELRSDALGINLSDDVASVPGLLARNRNNYAQDQQISIRGFGANSAFGIRGVRIYQDGIPATGPDGQGQVSQFNLDSAARVEILRGPFSALYGNSSGGVIQIFTQDGAPPTQLRSAVAFGSFGAFRAGANISGEAAGLGYTVDFTHFTVDGYRDHSSARNESFNAKLNYAINDANHLTLLTNVVSRPDAQDPLGVTPAQFNANPRQTAPSATAFNTRKSLDQKQAGLIYDLKLSDTQSIRALGYYGERSVEQYLSIPAATQVSATSAGGVVDLNRTFGGGDIRWSWQGLLAGRPLSWIIGLTYDRQNERRRGYNNFIGPTLGVQGRLRRDENNIVHDFDQYVQGSWDFAPDWSLMAGMRRSEVQFDSQDHFITATNGDDSGKTVYRATTPVAGLIYKPQSWLRLYASFGQGFQTPLGSELAYRADGGAGLNLALQPARSNNGELGAKMHFNADMDAQVAVFQAQTRNEIVVNTNIGGRSTYQNSGRTRRQGAEVSVDYRLSDEVRLQAAYTYIEAEYRDSYLTCTAAPCAQPTALVPAGNRLPGVPQNNIYAGVHWGRESGWHAMLEAQALGGVPVNDMNTVIAPAYTLLGADAGYIADLSTVRLSVFVRINNLLDRNYVGSVIVGDGNGRYFEPGPGRNFIAGINVALK